MNVTTRNRLIIGAIFIAAAALIGVQMYWSQTPPRHADHDHAIAKLNAGGFLWIEPFGGGRRNLVGRPGKVLVLHWFDPTAPSSTEQAQAARFAAAAAADPKVEVLLIAQAPSWEGLESWATQARVPTSLLYLDAKGKTGELCGVRRLPETLVYDPEGLLAHQARGPASWSRSGLGAQIERAKAGVDEIH
jgi:hypothetical protein